MLTVRLEVTDAPGLRGLVCGGERFVAVRSPPPRVPSVERETTLPPPVFLLAPRCDALIDMDIPPVTGGLAKLAVVGAESYVS